MRENNIIPHPELYKMYAKRFLDYADKYGAYEANVLVLKELPSYIDIQELREWVKKEKMRRKFTRK